MKTLELLKLAISQTQPAPSITSNRISPFVAYITHFHRQNQWCIAMFGKNRWLVTNKPVEFEVQPVEVRDSRKFTNHFRGIYRIYIIQMSTCNWLDLESLESQLTMPNKFLSYHPILLLYQFYVTSSFMVSS